MAVAFALFATDRPLWERVVIVLSAFPISVIVNVARIALTGLFLSMLDWLGWSSDMFEKISHDFAGLFMMPLALGLLYLVFQILKHLVIDTTEDVHSVAMPR
jgi:exosortase/archaeosortase family protein